MATVELWESVALERCQDQTDDGMEEMTEYPRDKLKSLCGKSRSDAVIRWLDDQRIPYLIGADGWPRVAEEVIDLRLGVINTKHKPRLNLEGLR